MKLLKTALEFKFKGKRLLEIFRIRWFAQALKETRKSGNF
jgi:hypothetical protein